ncbi:hypothetical protein WR25_25587 [Diploscapter pachys]|uniref:Uncharacterized protein n=1 Tax=Diploscapter pachys TaxID=2018661 RepID=A0A2A2JZ57_9BILA|nr:hypothetical protein WR25_25587 [Diploscapter pachys]
MIEISEIISKLNKQPVGYMEMAPAAGKANGLEQGVIGWDRAKDICIHQVDQSGSSVISIPADEFVSYAKVENRIPYGDQPHQFAIRLVPD